MGRGQCSEQCSGAHNAHTLLLQPHTPMVVPRLARRSTPWALVRTVLAASLVLSCVALLGLRFHAAPTAPLPPPKPAAAMRTPLAHTLHGSMQHIQGDDVQLPNYLYYHSPVDLAFGFVEREPGSFERIGSTAPRHPPLARKLGLVTVTVTGKSKQRVHRLLSQFAHSDFGIMLFITDDSQWTEFAWCADAIAVHAHHQTKYWFAKRYLTPDVVQNYDYIWLWDDAFGIDASFDPAAFVAALKANNVHFGQPAVASLTAAAVPPGTLGVSHQSVCIRSTRCSLR